MSALVLTLLWHEARLRWPDRAARTGSGRWPPAPWAGWIPESSRAVRRILSAW